MRYLIDTNILLRLAEPNHPMHLAAQNAINVLVKNGDELCVLPQNLIELWNVATRPAKYNGLGFTQLQTQAEVLRIEKFFRLILDKSGIYAEWKRLVIAHAVEGKEVHDTRIVAAMSVHRISQLLTFNKDDFKRFTNIVAVIPTELLPPV
ncbi:MAG: type II toxin-antitoxin system VapC family toxin [Blastocatellia bacterium]